MFTAVKCLVAALLIFPALLFSPAPAATPLPDKIAPAVADIQDAQTPDAVS